jgi:HEPN domain-containing protein
MSVMETKTIDGMGKSKEANELVLMISDHLDWEYESEHLLFLQEKINAYLAFLESKQYVETYPDSEFDAYIIEIHFKHDMTESCFKFLDKVANMVEPLKIRIRVELSE